MARRGLLASVRGGHDLGGTEGTAWPSQASREHTRGNHSPGSSRTVCSTDPGSLLLPLQRTQELPGLHREPWGPCSRLPSPRQPKFSVAIRDPLGSTHSSFTSTLKFWMPPGLDADSGPPSQVCGGGRLRRGGHPHCSPARFQPQHPPGPPPCPAG